MWGKYLPIDMGSTYQLIITLHLPMQTAASHFQWSQPQPSSHKSFAVPVQPCLFPSAAISRSFCALPAPPLLIQGVAPLCSKAQPQRRSQSSSTLRGRTITPFFLLTPFQSCATASQAFHVLPEAGCGVTVPSHGQQGVSEGSSRLPRTGHSWFRPVPAGSSRLTNRPTAGPLGKTCLRKGKILPGSEA